MDIVKQVQHRVSNVIGVLEHPLYEERLRELGLQSGEQKAQGELINVKKYLKGGTEEEEDRLFHGTM